MEGPSIREYPRMVLDTLVEIRVQNRRAAVKKAPGNLSVGGLFIQGQQLPVGTPVHVKITSPPFDADGIVRYTAGNGEKGVGIEFTSVPDAERKHLDQVIEDLTRKGAPAC